MTIEFSTSTPFQRGLEIAKQLAESSKKKGYFETILGKMEEIPVVHEKDNPRMIILGLAAGLTVNAPKLLFGLGTSAKNLIYKAR